MRIIWIYTIFLKLQLFIQGLCLFRVYLVVILTIYFLIVEFKIEAEWDFSFI